MKNVLLFALALAGSAMVMADETIVIDGSTTVGPIAKAFAEFYMENNAGVNISVSESGSGNGAKSLVNGACHIASMSRFMRTSEFKAALENDVTPVAHVVAVDGIAIVVHPANPVKNLTIEQVRNIYAGKITNWNQVGGPNARIIAISRDTNSGTYETFESLVMELESGRLESGRLESGRKEKIAEGVEYVGSNGAMRQRVQTTSAAIGYVGLGFVDRTIKALDINGVTPTKRSVVSGVYAIARPLYMFTNGYPKLGSHLHAFITLHLTRSGQEIIESVGFIPVTEY